MRSISKNRFTNMTGGACAEKGEKFFRAAADELAKLIDFYRHNNF